MRPALELVANRHALRDRQRTALQRCAASDEERRTRLASRVEPDAVRGEELAVDGYNVLLTVEAALGGGVLLLASDGTLRDLTAMSGHYRRVEETRPALEIMADRLEQLGCAEVRWYLDRPVSNSGRLKTLIEAVAKNRDSRWSVELTDTTDRVLMASTRVVASADSAILDRCRRWLNLARLVVEGAVPSAWVVELGATG